MEANDGTYQASGSANILLYIGLGMLSIGLIITFVGLGDKGFRTLELQLIGTVRFHEIFFKSLISRIFICRPEPLWLRNVFLPDPDSILHLSIVFQILLQVLLQRGGEGGLAVRHGKFRMEFQNQFLD